MDGQIDLKRIARVIADASPDLVALQEVDRFCTRSGNRDLAAELAGQLDMQHRFAKFMDYQGGSTVWPSPRFARYLRSSRGHG